MRWRRTVLVLLPCLLAACGLVALQRHWRNVHSIEASEHWAHLDSRIPELNWNDLSLQSAVDQLRQATGARIRVSDQISNYVPGPYGRLPSKFHARLRDVRLSTVLDILASGSRSATNGQTTYDLLPDGTILLLPEASAKRVVRIYDVRDLVSDPSMQNAAAAQSLEAAIQDAVMQFPLPAMKSSGRWTFVGTRREQACIAAALDALRRPPGKLDQSDRTTGALGRTVGPVHVRDVPIATLIDSLAAQAGVNLFIDWRSFTPFLTMAMPDKGVSVDFERLPLRAAINLLFKSTMVYSASDNVLLVTSYAPPISFRQVRGYELGDLVAACASRLRAQDAHPVPFVTGRADYYVEGAKLLLREVLGRSTTVGTGYFHGGSEGWFDTRLCIAAPADSHWELRRIIAAMREFERESSQSPPARPRFLSDGQDVFAGLSAPVKEISIDGLPLPTALASLQSASRVTIGFDSGRYLHRFEPTRLVRLHLWNVSLSVALHHVLKSASNTAPLDYSTDQGVIMVSAESPLWSVTRMYDVTDIARDSPANLDQLPNMIAACVDRTNSPSSGLNVARKIGGWLIVTQTPENHLRIESLLRALRNHQTIDAGGLWPDD